MTAEFVCDVAVVGAGPAGLLTGLCCSAAGLTTAVIGPPADGRDGRTAALLGPSVNVLKHLEVWDRVASQSAELGAIRLVDDTGSFVRAPEVLFRATEIGLEAFGANVPNAVLTRALEDAAAGKLRRIETEAVDRLERDSQGANVTTREGQTIRAALVAAADGRQSFCRKAAGIGVRNWAYDQSAVVTTFAHSRSHGGVSTEFHRGGGPLTLVPGPGNTSSLVWVERPDEAQRLTSLDDEQFDAELSAHLCGLLGKLSGFSPRRSYPISGQTADRLGANRVALIGEAAHVLPPIGAQGLNLSFRDAATIAEIAGSAKREGLDVGGAAVLADYEARRRPDTSARAWTIDLLNRSLLSEFPGVGLARGLGLFAISAIPLLKTQLMRQGITSASGLPEIMQPFDPIGDARPGPLDGPSPRQA